MPQVMAERPWGHWRVLEESGGYAVKQIVVAPGQRLSLHYHRRRTEHWTIIAGAAEIQIDQTVLLARAGDQIQVPPLARHCLHNIGAEPLVIVEVQIGGPVAEEDIVRLADDYDAPTKAR